MFDFESSFKRAADIAEEAEAIGEKLADLPVEDDWEDAEWEGITDAHAVREESSGRADARQSPEAMKDRIYRKINVRRRERTAITAVRYAMLAIGFGILAYFMAKYDISWLAWTLGIAGGIFGLISAYGAGKYREI